MIIYPHMENLLKGKKTYLVSLLMVAFAVIGVVIGQVETQKAMEIALEGLGLAGLRNAVK